MDHHYEEQHLDDAAHHYDDILEPLLLAVIALLLVLGLVTDFFSGAREPQLQQAGVATVNTVSRPSPA
ncbi:hypothetical protein [Chitinimonas sp.]|uniref:hypothetical protein n=1 Tax=Chitinimonas sp. TaxID=1934313 RepID=UPI002F94785D